MFKRQRKLTEVWHLLLVWKERVLSRLSDNFLLIGIGSLIWLILRSGRKPSRIVYPCQRVAAANVGLLLTLFPIIYIPRLVRFFKHKFDFKILLKSCLVIFLTCQLLLGVDMLIKRYMVQKSWQAYYQNKTPYQYSTIPSVQADPLPQVVSVHSSEATTWTGSGWPHDYLDQEEINKMVKQGILALTGETDYVQAWKKLIPYQTGEAVAIKLNWNNISDFSTNDMNPYAELVNAVIDGLVGMGVPADKIWLADPSRGSMPSDWRAKISNQNVQFSPYGKEFVTANSSYASTVNFNVEGQTSVRPAVVFCEAEHLINMPQLKGHGGPTITLGLKNHYGSAEVGPLTSYASRAYWHDYFYTYTSKYGTNGINPLIAINLNPQFKDKTRLVIGDGLYGNPTVNYDPPVLFKSFGNNPPEILFFGIDPIATDSVMFDYLQRECQAIGVAARVDHILEEAADAGLGVFEHWNNDTDRQYSLIDYVEIDLDKGDLPEPPAPEPPAPDPIMYGDVSGNGQITAYDAALALQYAAGLIDLTPEQITRADVTGNDSVSAYDAYWIACKAVDDNVKFPVEK